MAPTHAAAAAIPSSRKLTAHDSVSPLPDILSGLNAIDSLSAGSKKIYAERFTAMLAAVRNDPKQTIRLDASAAAAGVSPLAWCISHPRETWRALEAVRLRNAKGEERSLSVQTMRANANAANAVFRNLPPFAARFHEARGVWKKLYDTITPISTAKYEDSKPSAAQVKAHVEWADVLAARDRIRHKRPVDVPVDAHLILSLHTYMPPSRSDWGAIRVFVASDSRAALPAAVVAAAAPGSPPAPDSPAEIATPNFIVLSKSGIRLSMSVYKTASSNGRYVRDLPDELAAIVRASLAARPRSWLVCKHNGDPYSPHSYSVRVARILLQLLGKPATIDTLRHSFIIHSRIWELTPRQMEELAKDLRHSVSSMSRYRINFDGASPIPGALCSITCRSPASPA